MSEVPCRTWGGEQGPGTPEGGSHVNGDAIRQTAERFFGCCHFRFIMNGCDLEAVLTMLKAFKESLQ